MNRPLSDYLIAFLFSQFPKLEKRTAAQVPNAIRSRVDVSQIVNDSLYEWANKAGT